MRRDADFLDPRPPRGRPDRLHQSRHLRRERVPGQKRAGIDNQPVILHLAARDRRAGEEAQGLDREGQTSPSTVGFPSASKATPGGNASPVSAASNTSPQINDAVPMSKMTGPSADGKPKAIGLVPRAGRVAPGGTMCGAPLAVCRPTSPALTMRSR